MIPNPLLNAEPESNYSLKSMHFIYSIISLLTKLGKTFPKRVDSFCYQFQHVSFVFIHSFGRSVQSTSGGRWRKEERCHLRRLRRHRLRLRDAGWSCPKMSPAQVRLGAPNPHSRLARSAQVRIAWIDAKTSWFLLVVNYHDRSWNLVKSSLLHIGL